MTAQGDPGSVTVKMVAEISETDIATIRENQRLREDLGLDSLQSLELLSRIGEELDVELDVEEAMSIRTVRDACVFVQNQCEKQHGQPAA